MCRWLVFIPFPPHPCLRIDAGDCGGVDHSMAQLLATKGEPLTQSGIGQKHRLLPLHHNPTLSPG